MKLVPLGDQGVLAYTNNEAEAGLFAAAIRSLSPGWLVDVVQAYSSIAIFFDLNQITFNAVKGLIQKIQIGDTANKMQTIVREHVIPCCYEFQLDMGRIAAQTGLSLDDIIERHGAISYTVYAIGFCPGFPYLGYLPPELSGVPRLASPRLHVEKGSVGLTGRQTGIYTEARPGGWNLIGRTPLELVHLEDGYFPLRTGDRVRFRRIDEHEFRAIEGQRL